MSATPPQDVINTTYGALVTGIWIQQLFLGYILAQMIDYYRKFYHTDKKFNRIIVHALLFLNVFLGAIDFHVLYRTSVLHYGDYDHFDGQAWTMSSEPGWTAIVGLVAQIFFLNRCHNIVQSKLLTIFLLLLVLFCFGSGAAVSISFMIYGRFSSLGNFKKPIILWLTSTAGADIVIAIVLAWHLIRSRTGFRKTDALITRLITLSMETSAMTALVALLNLVLYLPLQDTAYHLLPQFSISRIYTITVMVTLLARDKQRRMLNSTEAASFPTAIRVGVTTSTQCDFRNPTAKDQEYELSTQAGQEAAPDKKSYWQDDRPGTAEA
ncbi:hypothetical protein FB107DRAFT_290968 [Schizophyllum commune]